MNLVKCERLDDFGRGIVYIDGKVCFVPNLLPLEEAYISVVLDKKKYSVGKILSLEKESPDRIQPKCSYLKCGCSLKHLKYEKQLEYKWQKVSNIMKKYVKSNFISVTINFSTSYYIIYFKITFHIFFHNVENFLPFIF